MGAIGGFIADFGLGSSSKPGVHLLALACAYGLVSGELILRLAGRNRPVHLGLTAALGLISGAIGGRMIVGIFVFMSERAYHPGWLYIESLMSSVMNPMMVTCLVAAVVCAAGRIYLNRIRGIAGEVAGEDLSLPAEM